MASQDNPNPPSHGQLAPILLAVFVAIIVLAVAGLVVLLIRPSPLAAPSVEITATVVVTVEPPTAMPTWTPAASQTPLPTYTPLATLTPFPTFTPEPTSTPAPTPTPVPTPSWRGLGNLTSIEFNLSTVVEKQRQRPGIGDVLLGPDRIVLMAVGKIKAGVDLNRIRPSDVQISGTKIRVVLPRAEIVSVELLPEQSRIFDSKKSWLFSEYQGLELEALEEARQKLRDEAEKNAAMMELAETMARLQLIELLRKAGYEDIEIVFVK
jgi:hypothetical protein